MHRRNFMAGLAGLAATPALARERPAKAFAGAKALEALERSAGGRLGVYVLDTGTGQGFGWRADERFAMCSTFKLSLAALMLREIDAGRLNAREVLPYAALDLLPNSPVTGANRGLTVTALAEAAQKFSDNTAANLLLRRLGGPEALTAFWRSLGDPVSRLDRFETALNFVPAREQRDTTSPQAIGKSAAQFLTGSVLTTASRGLLQQWMTATTTGAARLRAGFPAGWPAGDKTGTAMSAGMESKINDIAILTPPGKPPHIVTAFYEPAGAPQQIRPQDEAVLASAGRIAADPKSWRLR